MRSDFLGSIDRVQTILESAMKLDLDILTEEAEEALVQHGLVGPASRDFVAWMESKRLPQDLIRALTRMSPKKEIWAGAGALFAEEGIIKVNEDFPQALRAELFYVGCAGNGDPIAIDLGPGAGATGYIDHEMVWDV